MEGNARRAVGPDLHEAGPRLQYLQDDRDFELFEDTTGFVSWLHNVQHDDDLAPLVDAGIMTLLHKVHLEGGDPLERLAWANSQATNSSAFALDLEAAQRGQAKFSQRPAAKTERGSGARKAA